MRFTDDETKYQAILNRDPQAEGEFVMVPYQHESSVVLHATVELQCAKTWYFLILLLRQWNMDIELASAVNQKSLVVGTKAENS